MKQRSNRQRNRETRGQLTMLLSNFNDVTSLNAALRLVYDDLHHMATSHFRGERRNHTLQPTALMHEALIRLIESGGTYPNRAYFFGAASKAMRRILIESARRHSARKRGGDWVRTELDEATVLDGELVHDLVDFDGALTRLEAMDSELSQIVELRAICGFTAQETATILGIGESTGRAKWAIATRWLRQELASQL